MIDTYAFSSLSDAQFMAWARRKTAELRALDREILELERSRTPEAFRKLVAEQAIEALHAMGVVHATARWMLGVIETRLWILEILSAPITTTSYTKRTRSPRESAPFRPPDSPLGEFLLWLHVFYLALGVRDARLSRKFGSPNLTHADLEQARNTAGFPNDRWLAMRDRAAWMLRK